MGPAVFMVLERSVSHGTCKENGLPRPAGSPQKRTPLVRALRFVHYLFIVSRCCQPSSSAAHGRSAADLAPKCVYTHHPGDFAGAHVPTRLTARSVGLWAAERSGSAGQGRGCDNRICCRGRRAVPLAARWSAYSAAMQDFRKARATAPPSDALVGFLPLTPLPGIQLVRSDAVIE